MDPTIIYNIIIQYAYPIDIQICPYHTFWDVNGTAGGHWWRAHGVESGETRICGDCEDRSGILNKQASPCLSPCEGSIVFCCRKWIDSESMWRLLGVVVPTLSITLDIFAKEMWGMGSWDTTGRDWLPFGWPRNLWLHWRQWSLGQDLMTFCLPKEKAPMKATSYTVNSERCVKDQADVQDESGWVMSHLFPGMLGSWKVPRFEEHY